MYVNRLGIKYIRKLSSVIEFLNLVMEISIFWSLGKELSAQRLHFCYTLNQSQM